MKLVMTLLAPCGERARCRLGTEQRRHEFWWPRAKSLNNVFLALRGAYGVVRGIMRNVVPRLEDGGVFAEGSSPRLADRRRR